MGSRWERIIGKRICRRGNMELNEKRGGLEHLLPVYLVGIVV
jgi:hypothetical protein